MKFIWTVILVNALALLTSTTTFFATAQNSCNAISARSAGGTPIPDDVPDLMVYLEAKMESGESRYCDRTPGRRLKKGKNDDSDEESDDDEDEDMDSRAAPAFGPGPGPYPYPYPSPTYGKGGKKGYSPSYYYSPGPGPSPSYPGPGPSYPGPGPSYPGPGPYYGKKGGKGGKGYGKGYGGKGYPSGPVFSPIFPTAPSTFGGCCQPEVFRFSWIQKIPNFEIAATGVELGGIGTVYITNDVLYNSTGITLDSLVDIPGSGISGHCTKAGLTPGLGFCHFTYTITVASDFGSVEISFNGSGELVDEIGGVLSITGGNLDLVGASGDIVYVPDYGTSTNLDILTGPQFYRAEAVIFLAF